MNRQRDQLIADLVSETTPIKRTGSTLLNISIWLACSSVFSFAVMLWVGPFRDDAIEHAMHHPQLFIEILLGVATIISLAYAGFKSAIPSPENRLGKGFLLPMTLLGLWLAMQFIAFMHPAMAPTMEGKRDHCWLEALTYGIPGLIFGTVWLHRLWPLKPGWSGFFLGLSAGAVPAVMMQLSCMYEPKHNLLFHTLPGLLLGVMGAIVGLIFLRKK